MPERLRHHIERSRSNTYEWSFCVGLLFLSVYGLIWEPPSESLDEGLSFQMRFAYSSIGLIGALFTIAGLRVKDSHAALLLERIGQLAVAGGSFTFIVVLCWVSTFAESGIVTGTMCAICAGSVGRVVQITRDLRRERRLMSAALGIQEAVERLAGHERDGDSA